MPEPHMPEPHPPPPPIFGMFAPADSKEDGIALLESGEKVAERSFVISMPLHSGQEIPSVPAPMLRIIEKTFPHPHLYSYTGIFLTSS
jgi:hypothetical protein